MQRLNAVFSFIENDYPVANGEYFDLSTTALTKDLLDSHILVQRQPVLNRETCVKIVSYELPYSIYDEHDPDIIDEVFRRINSNGKHLSRQEIRQAGVVNDFSQLVRNIATRIRGDVSHNDFLLLSQMQNISITKDTYHGGIDPESVFWVKENILSKEDLRQSMDEEQIADILGAMLLTPVPPSNVSILDEYYGYKQPDASVRYQKIEEALSAISPEKVSEQFFYVYDEIKRVFSGRQKTIITQMVSPRTYRGPRYFQVLFLSMYELLVRQEKRIANYDALYNALDGIGARIIHISGGGGWWSQQEKIDLIAATSGVLAPHFVERGEGDPMLYSYANELETLLKQSSTENTQYDFKQGIHNLDDGRRNNTLIQKIFKTLTAMANAGKNATGYVLLGVADTFDDAEKIRQVYGQESIRVGDFYVTGVNGEVEKYYENYDAYILTIRNALNDMPLQDHYRRQIGAKMRHVNYHGKSVIILRITCNSGPAIFDGAYYTRSGPSNGPVPVKAEEMPAFFAQFA